MPADETKVTAASLLSAIGRERAQRELDKQDCPRCPTPDPRKPPGGVLRLVTYGDGKPYGRCPIGHVTPPPPPVDIAAIEACDEDD